MACCHSNSSHACDFLPLSNSYLARDVISHISRRTRGSESPSVHPCLVSLSALYQDEISCCCYCWATTTTNGWGLFFFPFCVESPVFILLQFVIFIERGIDVVIHVYNLYIPYPKAMEISVSIQLTVISRAHICSPICRCSLEDRHSPHFTGRSHRSERTPY